VVGGYYLPNSRRYIINENQSAKQNTQGTCRPYRRNPWSNSTLSKETLIKSSHYAANMV